MSLSDPVVIIGLVLASVLAVVGLLRPFVGLLVLILIHFVQPAELLPALAPFRVELVYGILVIVSFVLHRASGPSRPLFSSRILIGAVLLLGVATLTVPFAVWRGGALDQTITLTKLVVIMFLIGTLVDTNKRLRAVVWILVALLAWYAGSALRSYARGELVFAQDIERAVGVTSVVGDPNALAGVIVGLLPFLIAAIRFTRMIAARLLLLSVFPLAIATLIVTGSRASLLALLAVALYYVLRSKRRVISLACLAVVVGLVWIGMPQQYKDRYLTVKSYAQGGQLDESNELRLRVWKAGWRMFLDHPVLGVGAGQFSTAYGTVYSGRTVGPWMQPHNLLIQVGCEFGLVGLVIFGYFVFQIVKANRSILRLKGEGSYRLNYEVAVACGALLAGVAIVSVVGHTLYRPYWYLLGGLVAANRFVADQVEKSEIGRGPSESVGASLEAGSQPAPATVVVNGKT